MKTVLASALLLIFISEIFCYPQNEQNAPRKIVGRPQLITKYNFLQYQRDKKLLDIPKVPEPFIVRTELNVKAKPEDSGKKSRSSRAFSSSNKAIEARGILVEGVRMPDDETDKTTYRNGRFINNIFVPDEQIVRSSSRVGKDLKEPRSFGDKTPEKVKEKLESRLAIREKAKTAQAKIQKVEESAPKVKVVKKEPKINRRTGEQFEPSFEEPGQSRDYSYHAGSAVNGRPVYYVVEEGASSTASLHNDRSPYHYEPADAFDSLSPLKQESPLQNVRRNYNSNQRRPQQQQHQKPQKEGYEIKEQSYSLCPGCPEFTIPIPIPKQEPERYQYRDQYNENGNRESFAASASTYPNYEFVKSDYGSAYKGGDEAEDVRTSSPKKQNSGGGPLAGFLALPKFEDLFPFTKKAEEKEDENVQEKDKGGDLVAGLLYGFPNKAEEKDAEGAEDEEEEDVGFLQKMSENLLKTLKNIQKSAFGLIDPLLPDALKSRKDSGGSASSKKKPFAKERNDGAVQTEELDEKQGSVFGSRATEVAAITAAAVGGFALLTSAATLSTKFPAMDSLSSLTGLKGVQFTTGRDHRSLTFFESPESEKVIGFDDKLACFMRDMCSRVEADMIEETVMAPIRPEVSISKSVYQEMMKACKQFRDNTAKELKCKPKEI